MTVAMGAGSTTALAAALIAAALLAVPGAVARTRVRSWRLADGAGAAAKGRGGVRRGGMRRGGLRGVGARGGLRAPAVPAVAVAAAVAVLAALTVLIGWAAAAASAVLGATAVHLRSRRAAAGRREHESKNMALALEIMAAELKTGAHPGGACAAAAGWIPAGAAARRLETAAAQAQLGGSIALSLGAQAPVRGGVEDGAWSRVAAVWRVSERRGIALAGLLDSARRDVRVRAGFHRRREAGLSGARATATVLAALPVVGIGFGFLMGARPLHVLFGGGAGGVLLVVGVALDCAGLAWAERIGSGGGNGAGR